ncbi:MAG: pyrroline-5-carboxylate reductase [Candidatus Latescibacterota bacterium]
MIQDKRIAIIGVGNMGEALAGGIVTSALLDADRITAFDADRERLQAIAAKWKIVPAGSLTQAIEDADVILLAVKPQTIPAVLAEIRATVTSQQMVLSIAAGVPTSLIEEQLKVPCAVVRAMPNTPALVGCGMAAICPGTFAQKEHLLLAQTILGAVGDVVVVTEKQMDAVTGLSGSGPAYVYTFIEALSDGGVKMGLPRSIALKLAAETVLGAAQMVLETGEHPAVLRDRVTSPGGTTITGMQVLESKGFRDAAISAVEAATKRSEELGQH